MNSDEKINKKLIGEMFHENWIDKLNFEEIRECIKNVSLLEIVSENVKPNAVHSLPNGKILFITSNLVSILDENFNIIKSKEMMGVVGCALKDENEIYLVDSINSCIYIIDSELEIKVKNPKTTFWVNELFYVNDDGNFRDDGKC